MERIFEYRLRPNKQQEAALLKVLKRLHRSLTAFFTGRKEGRAVGFPRFKPAQRWHTIGFRDKANVLDGRYFKAGMQCGGRIRMVVHRPVIGEFRFARIVKQPSGWYLQCVCRVAPKPFVHQCEAIGLDLGITYLVADSDGNRIANPPHYRRILERLAKVQQRLARCQKGSRRRRKAAKQVVRIHEKIKNQRQDTLHKISRHYADRHRTIVVEDLHPATMVKNHHLARSINDSSWARSGSISFTKWRKLGRGRGCPCTLHVSDVQEMRCVCSEKLVCADPYLSFLRLHRR